MANEFYLLCIHLVLLLSINNSSVAAKELPKARPGCPDHCGAIPIPYPFGTNKDCYKNEWYHIVCNHTSRGPAAFLSKINLEVLNITLQDGHQSTVVVKSHVISSACSRAETIGSDGVTLFNLTGSPFVITANNTFTALGCDSLWLLLLNEEPSFTGCLTTCNKTKVTRGDSASCSGYKCCHFSIPDNIQVVEAGVSNESRDCRFAFLNNNGSFSPQPDVSNQQLIEMSKTSFRLELKWGVEDIGPYKHIKAVECERNNISNNGTLYYCLCKDGYRGNPYLLPEGCEDIDECKNHPNPCGKASCINIHGSYRCHTLAWLITLVVTLGSGLLIFAGGAGWVWRSRVKRKEALFERNGGRLLKERLHSSEDNVYTIKIFRIKDMERATENFSGNRVLGHGGQGTVYKGDLEDGTTVAIKRAKAVDKENVEDFINEISILSQINHRNIVRLLGCCLETESPILVYEFIPNGDLFHHLHAQSKESSLTWEVRLCIAKEIAWALYYLHFIAYIPIYHRDIKSTNILLDEYYTAKVSDFGISRNITADQTHLTTDISGTLGYIDPEYFQLGQFTDKSDVYSFGVVLVELLTGERPISAERNAVGLAPYFLLSMQDNKLFDILDPQIQEQCNPQDVIAVANVASRCLNFPARTRPSMREVALELERTQSSQKTPMVQTQTEGGTSQRS